MGTKKRPARRGKAPQWFTRLGPDAQLALLDDPYRELTEPLVTALGPDAENVVGRVYTAHERSTRYYLAPRAAVELVSARDRVRGWWGRLSPLHRVIVLNNRHGSLPAALGGGVRATGGILRLRRKRRLTPTPMAEIFLEREARARR
ncbi:hypothetical protein AB0H71_01045 [Nocardia sp. NPDC050697]|uniref:hypothetical protein n=1 Tax=Nocardia sp. NPDC050697 TaxID=3155158 RepID=UPI0033C69111